MKLLPVRSELFRHVLVVRQVGAKILQEGVAHACGLALLEGEPFSGHSSCTRSREELSRCQLSIQKLLTLACGATAVLAFPERIFMCSGERTCSAMSPTLTLQIGHLARRVGFLTG